MSGGLHLVLVGDSKVGKTCLINAYGTGSYSEEYEATVAFSYLTSIIINKEQIDVTIHDTGGSQAKHTSNVRQQLYNKAHVFVVCFNLCDMATFHHVERFWVNEIRRIRRLEVPLLIVGCQADSRDPGIVHHVKREQALQLAYDLGCHYFESSSITQKNIKVIFDKAVKVAMDLEPCAMDKQGSSCLGVCLI